MKTNKNYNIKDKTMKYLFTLSLVSLLFFFGCDPGSDPTSPISDSPNQQLKETSVFHSSDNGITRNPYLHREDYPPGSESIFIPLNLPPSVIPNLEVSKMIDGQFGGFLEIDFDYDEPGAENIIIYARLDIAPRSFEGSKQITMKLNNEKGIISFYPHMDFNQPANLDVMYDGINLDHINSVDFIFQKMDGTIESVTYESIDIDNAAVGYLYLNDAMLYHFSRYGFVNRQF